MDEPEFASRVTDEYVLPLYMSIPVNIPDRGMAKVIARNARAVTLEELLWVLGGHWRPRRVGAWFALVRAEPEVIPAVLQSLQSSLGYLTAPFLGFAAVRKLGAEAVPALLEYQAIAEAKNYGGVSLITALIEAASGSSLLAKAEGSDREWLANMTVWAELLEGS